MPSNRGIAELATLIKSKTADIDEYLKSNGLQSPSFDIDAPEKLQLPVELALAKDAILEAADELNSLLLGPVDFLTNYNVSRAPLPPPAGKTGSRTTVYCSSGDSSN